MPFPDSIYLIFAFAYKTMANLVNGLFRIWSNRAGVRRKVRAVLELVSHHVHSRLGVQSLKSLDDRGPQAPSPAKLLVCTDLKLL
jgi:hypothetical protein